MKKAFKGFTGTKNIGGELLKFKNGYTDINGKLYTIKQLKELLEINEEIEFPKSEGW